MNLQTPKLVPLKKWMNHSSIRFFENNPDALGVPGFIPLCNQMIVEVMSTGFEVVTRDTFFMTCRARQILSRNLKETIYKEDEIFAAETALDAHFERLHDFFDTRIQQAEKKIELGGFDLNKMQRLVTNYETKAATNGVTQYLEILGKADYYITLLHYLWVTSELSDNPDEARRVKLNTEREVRHHLFGVPRTTNGHYNNIRRICNGVTEKRQQERLEQAERDRKRQAEKQAKRQAAIEQKVDERHDKRKTKAKKIMRDAQSDMDQLGAQPAAA